MNILIPHQWLLEHLETEATPSEIQKHVSLSGPSIERIYDREGEPVYDIEVTTNRVDAMSVRGIAREAAVILTNAGWPSRLKNLDLPESIEYTGDRLDLPKIVNDSGLCDRILCVVLDTVQHGNSPAAMQKRLKQVDLNTKDVVIDITNYVTHELGHPCHAFDYDKIMALGGEVHVVEAEADMPFTTLDGMEYTTVGGEVVFVNQEGTIIDLPAIKGTANTAVDDNTKRVLLWVESIAADKVRFASMTHGIRTTAAQLNERDLDHNLGREVLLQAIGLYRELAKAQVASPIYDEVATPVTPPTITLKESDLVRYLGLKLPDGQVREILVQLGCAVNGTAEGWQVTPPSFRTDLAIPADLVEEVARIYGYHKIPSRILQGEIPTTYPTDSNFAAEELISNTLAALGYQEQITYSLTPQPTTPQKVLALKNPLTLDKEVLRTHLLPSHLEVMRNQWGVTNLRGTFELANIYTPRSGELPDEHLVLGVVDRDIRALRSTWEVIANRLFISLDSVNIREESGKKDGYIDDIFESAAFITQDDRVLGIIGWLPGGMAGMELQWRELLSVAKRWPEYKPLTRTSALTEDWTIQVKPGTSIQTIVDELRTVDTKIQKVSLLDTYEDRWTFRITMQDRDVQMSSTEAERIRDKVSKALTKYSSKLL